jgi:hypothetical protein
MVELAAFSGVMFAWGALTRATGVLTAQLTVVSSSRKDASAKYPKAERPARVKTVNRSLPFGLRLKIRTGLVFKRLSGCNGILHTSWV